MACKTAGMQTISDFIVWMRPLRQKAIADLLEVSEATLSRMKTGAQAITPDVAEKVEALSHGKFAKERVLWPEPSTSTVEHIT